MDLQQYKFTIEHRSGKANANADALSRMYDEETEENFNENTLGVFMAEWDESDDWKENYESDEEMWGANYPSESEEESDFLDFPALYTREEVEELYPHIFEIQKPIGYTYYLENWSNFTLKISGFVK